MTPLHGQLLIGHVLSIRDVPENANEYGEQREFYHNQISETADLTWTRTLSASATIMR